MQPSMIRDAGQCSGCSSLLQRRPLLSRPLSHRRLSAPRSCFSSHTKPSTSPSQSSPFSGPARLHGCRPCGRPLQQSTSQAKRDADSDDSMDTGGRDPPNIFWRVFAALMYIIPWIDVIALGREVYHNFPFSITLFLIPGPFVGIYYSSQFAPLVVFFLLFLSVVKNTKLHHFVRFNAMQGIMLDIVAMLFSIVRAYFPAEVRWSAILPVFDMFSWNICMGTIIYCVFWTLWGKYADVPYVSDSVYMQVEASDPA
ncbi:Protein TIC 20-II, chloroplastic [Trebouxia sp. C0010 RCD-2024]